MTLRRIVARLVLVCAAAAFVPARAAEPPAPYDLYVILALTGNGAFVGRGIQTTYRSGEAYVNRTGGIRGRPLHIVIEDDQSNPALTVQLMSALIAKKVAVVMGPSFGQTCAAVLPLIRNGPVTYCFSNSIHPPAGSFAFSANPSTKDYTMVGLRYFRGRGWKKLALLTSTDVSGQDGETVALEDLKSPELRDLQLVANEHFAPTDLTVSAQIERIKAAGADAIDAWTTGTPFGTVLRSLNESGLDIPILTNAGNINNAQIEQYRAFLPKQVFFTAPMFLGRTELQGQTLRAYTNLTDLLHADGIANPDVTMLVGWDPLMLTVAALRAAGPDPSSEQVRAALAQLHGYTGVMGAYDFRDGSQRGLDPRASLIVRYDPATKDWPPVSKPGGAPL